jgi:large subunit ribosomal protein L31
MPTRVCKTTAREDLFPNLLKYVDVGIVPLVRICYNIGYMKKDLHPADYRLVVFQDLNNSTTYLTRSTVATDETIELDGTTYPLVKVHISSSSHPFFTGEERVLDIEGRVDKFKARAEAAKAARDSRIAAARKQKSRAEAKAARASDNAAEAE